MSARLSVPRHPVWLFAVTVLAACSAMVPVHVARTLAQPVATFGLSAEQPERACVEHLGVSRSHDQPIWSLDAKRGCRTVRQLAYGEVPDGFVQSGQAAPLQADQTYLVRASGRSKSALSAVPWTWAGYYRFENGQWKAVVQP
ncbi:hypothetical protein [Brevundimonas sp. UBA5713]|nr:hypothetical protein [Brevundimonas sp. UBA5713]